MNFANETLRDLFYHLLDGDPNEDAKRGTVDAFFDTYEVAISLRSRVATDEPAVTPSAPSTGDLAVKSQ